MIYLLYTLLILAVWFGLACWAIVIAIGNNGKLPRHLAVMMFPITDLLYVKDRRRK